MDADDLDRMQDCPICGAVVRLVRMDDHERWHVARFSEQFPKKEPSQGWMF